MTEPATQGTVMDFSQSTDRVARFVTPGDFVTIKESSNSADGRTYQWNLPAAADINLNCVTEVSRADTGYWRQIIFEGTTGDCAEEITRASNIDASEEVIQFRVYPETEPPVLGVFFDMDVSVNREISMQREGYATVRVNEAATSTGYAWTAPSDATLDALECVDVVDKNYGGLTTGYI